MAVINPILVSKRHNSVTLKLVGTALGDVGTINLSTPITISNDGNVTFDAINNTITRTIGSWITDGVTIGSILVIAGTTSNNGTFIVKTVSATIITIERNIAGVRNYLVNETAASATYAGSYKSDLLMYGQTITGTPKVNIARLHINTSSVNIVTIARNSVNVWVLFGQDDINYSTDEYNTYPIVTTFVDGPGGVVIFELSKIDGFSDVNPIGYSA